MKLRVDTHDGNSFDVVVEEYDPVALNQELNSHEINTVVLGDLVVSRINVKSVKPIDIENVE